MKAMKRMSYRLPDDLLSWLNRQAVKEDKTPSYILRRALIRERKIAKRHARLLRTGVVQ